MNTEMQLFDIYRIPTGGKAFIGTPKHELPVIISSSRPYKATLIVDGDVYQENIKIIGSTIPEMAPDGQRTIGTKDKVDLDAEFVKKHDCRLILIDQLTIEVLTKEEYQELILATLDEIKMTS
jgi:hypothetical protein